MTDDNNIHQVAGPEPLVSTKPEPTTDEPPGSAGESSAEGQTGNGASEFSSPGMSRRLRLNPNVDESQFKAVPTLPPQSGEPSSSVAVQTPAQTPSSAATDARPAAESAAVANPPNAETAGSSDPDSPSRAGGQDQEEESRAEAGPHRHVPAQPTSSIEIPPAIQQLDAQLEAEIDAAMASGELDFSETTSALAVEEDAAQGERTPEELLEPGHHLTGRIQSIHADNVFLELGYRSTGVVALRQFSSGKKPEVGQRIEVLIDRLAPEEGLIHLNLPKGVRRIAGNWDSLAKGQIVDCIVNRTNKGGLEVTVSGLRAFLPSSQVDLGFVSDLDPYVGQKLRVEVVEVNRKKRNLVVSRRAYLQIERKELEGKFWESVDVGQTFTGRVKTIKDYGAFVDLGAIDGFLHIGDITWHRIKHPSEVIKEGQTVDVKVLSLDREKKKISLGMKQLAQNPWTTAADRFPPNSAVTGRVTRIADFGAFVELEPGLEGLIHVSELDHRHVRHASDVVKVNQVVTAQVLEVDVERKRVGLSLKALLARPEERKPEPEAPPAESIQRRRKGPLKGGTGSSARGGLFGNPSDYSGGAR